MDKKSTKRYQKKEILAFIVIGIGLVSFLILRFAGDKIIPTQVPIEFVSLIMAIPVLFILLAGLFLLNEYVESMGKR